MGFNQITPVVKNLIIINAIMFLGGGVVAGAFGLEREMLGLHYFQTKHFHPFQVATHMFMHADLWHLFFNMLVLFFFGPILEATWGAKRFLSYYIFTGLGAAALHTLVQYIELNYFYGPVNIYDSFIYSWGASGATFGVLLAYGVYFPNNVVSLIIPPVSLPAKYFVIILAVMELFIGVSGVNTGIAHFAHLGGALFGLLMIWYWRSSGRH